VTARGAAAAGLLAAGIAAATLTDATQPARAEKLITSLSTYRVFITSQFTGAELMLFGTIERDAATVSRRGGYDIVVTITGPRETTTVRRKRVVLGIWVNTESRAFVDVPSFLAIRSNRPITEIADPELLRRNQIGLDYIVLPQQIGNDVADVQHEDPFRMAFLRLQKERGQYRERDNAVTFLTPTVFRAAITLPADVPIGTYEIDVKLLSDGALLWRDTSAFETVKVAFEQFVASAARDHGLLYGLVTALMALVIGWIASVVFRRD
jgi:uncharacterized protein (TIGR02186 family)